MPEMYEDDEAQSVTSTFNSGGSTSRFPPTETYEEEEAQLATVKRKSLEEVARSRPMASITRPQTREEEEAQYAEALRRSLRSLESERVNTNSISTPMKKVRSPTG